MTTLRARAASTSSGPRSLEMAAMRPKERSGPGIWTVWRESAGGGGFRRTGRRQPFAGGCLVGLEMGTGGDAVTGQKIERDQPPGNRRAPGRIARGADRVERLDVSGARAGVTELVEELRVFHHGRRV